MPFLVRKVSPAKWEEGQGGIEPGVITADAVTADLRTAQNKLSFWRCESTDAEHLDKVALVMATNIDEKSRIVLTWLDAAEVEENGLVTEASPGVTVVKDPGNEHVDIVGLDLSSLGLVAKMISKSVNAEKCHRIPKTTMFERIVQAVRDGQVRTKDLEGKLKVNVEEALKNTRSNPQ